MARAQQQTITKDDVATVNAEDLVKGGSVATVDKGGAAQAAEPRNALATTNVEEDAGGGFEGITANELAIPFFVILQKGSPQCEDGNPAAIPGAKPGMIMNTVTQELFDGKDKGIRVIPAYRQERYIEWTPRDDGGGLVNVHDPASDIVLNALRKAESRFGKLPLDNGNELAQTFSVYVLVEDEDGNTQHGIIAFGSTQIKHYKRWMTTARSIVGRNAAGQKFVMPLWSRAYRLKTQFEQNKKGTWYGWLIRFDGANATAAEVHQDSATYAEAKLFNKMVDTGQVREDTAGLQHTNAEGGEAEDDGRF